MSQNYGVLRVVRVRSPDCVATNLPSGYVTGWPPRERLVHVLVRRRTTIGRALVNDIVLMDSAVSREHACLVLDQHGWHIVNLTARNAVRVNGRPVAGSESLPVVPLDTLTLGSTALQLVAQDPPQSLSRRQEPPLSSPQDVVAAARPLPTQPYGEGAAQLLREEEDVPGSGTKMQFAWPSHEGGRTRWLMAAVGLVIPVICTIVAIALGAPSALSALAQHGIQSVLAVLTIPLIPAVGISLLVNFADRFEREPWFLRLAAFLWGAIVATPLALFIEQRIDTTLQSVLGPDLSNVARSALQGLNAGATEETVKGLALLLLFLTLGNEFDNVTDGIVYGALIGAGFAMVENFRYFALDFQRFPVFLIVNRIVLSWLTHSTFTVCFGAALGYTRHTRILWRQITLPIVGYVAAVGLHSAFNFILFLVSALELASPSNDSVALFSLLVATGDYLPPLGAQIVIFFILIKALTHEAEVIREFLAPEVSSGVVKVDEYVLLQDSFQRTREERRVLRSSGIRQWMRVKALYQTEIRLAFAKWHVSMAGKATLGYPQSVCAYRQRIERLRYAIAMAGVKAR
ncbi:MAG: PrsW family glutamic-type intramembrane protease [Ktedonobacteraceae bacterium]